MSPEAKHTPLPWKLMRRANQRGMRRLLIVGVGTQRLIADLDYLRPTPEAATATAEFIVRACNSHYELLAALKLAEAQMAVARRFLPKHGSFGEEGITNYEEARTAVAKAIAKAEVSR